ncbi:hypothetical protein GCM10027563_19200 [Parasphingorhabdus pacifica]
MYEVASRYGQDTRWCRNVELAELVVLREELIVEALRRPAIGNVALHAALHKTLELIVLDIRDAKDRISPS